MGASRKTSSPAPSETRDRLQSMQAIASRFEGWRPAAEVLTRVRAVPTIFPQIDRATRVGGWPIERIATVHGPSNHGKAQPVDEPVLTPQGWVPIGSLVIGDWVIGSDGRKVCVTGVYPQGRKPVYEVVFDDGGSTRACAEHLWFTTTISELNRGRYVRGPRPARARKRIKDGDGSVKNTATIAATLDAEHTIPFVQPVRTEADDSISHLPVDPYVLGLLLGDGSFRSSCLLFTAADDELHAALAAEAERHGDELVDATSGDRCRTSRVVRGGRGSHVMPVLRRLLLALDGHRSEDKYVPVEYLWANCDARLALLRGLMDTDGAVSNEGTQAQFATTSPHLRDAVVHLVRSLGGRALVYPHATTGLPSWCVMVSFADGTNPFLLKRKAVRWKVRMKALRRRIVAVRPFGDAECVCIRVSAADSLYVARDFVITHNTAFCHGLGLSFLERDHFYGFVDAEFTTPEAWLSSLMGRYHTHPGFVAMRPHSFEQTVDAVRKFVETIGDAREKGEIDRETSGLVVIDSIRKLIPERLLEKILKEGAEGKKGSVDGMSGRGAMYKAALQSQWLDELVPLMAKTGTGMVIIAREADDPTADARDLAFDNAWKVQGSKSLIYDASLVVRITRERWVTEGSEADQVVIGEKHRARIWKTKIGEKDDRHVDAFFHTSNGQAGPVGFDRARDVFELALEHELIEQKGAWFSLASGERLGQGASKAIAAIREKHLVTLEAEVRAKFESVQRDAHEVK